MAKEVEIALRSLHWQDADPRNWLHRTDNWTCYFSRHSVLEIRDSLSVLWVYFKTTAARNLSATPIPGSLAEGLHWLNTALSNSVKFVGSN
jgi:hypothetical protein